MATLNIKDTSIRTYSAMLVEMFNSISLQRVDGTYKVPVIIDSFDANTRKDLETESKSNALGMELPYIAIKFIDITYDAPRALNRWNRRVHMMFAGNRAILTYEDVPVTLNYNVTIQTKTANDLYAITEFIQSEFKHNIVRKKVNLPLYDGTAIVTPITLNGITVDDELALEEGRECSAQINMNVNGILNSYINGIWKDVLSYYRQLKLVDSDKDGILDSYILPGTETIVQIGGEEDKAFVGEVLVQLANEMGIAATDIMTRPTYDLTKIGNARIEKILIRIWEEDKMQHLIQTATVVAV